MVLAADSESALERLERDLVAAGVEHVAIREPDAPWCGALTAIGLAPLRDRSTVKRLLAAFPLLGRKAAQVA